MARMVRLLGTHHTAVVDRNAAVSDSKARRENGRWPSLLCAAILAWACVFPRQVAAQADALQRLAQRVAPHGSGTPQRLSHYIRCFQDATFQDSRIFAFEVTAKPLASGKIELVGHVEFVEIRTALIAYLDHLGFQEIDDRLQLLPAKQLGDRRFGLVTASHSLVLTQPKSDAETATDALLGEPLFLLRATNAGFLLCHTAEGYIGYIRSRDVLRVDATDFHRYRTGKQVRVRKRWTAASGLTVPVGARLKWAAQAKTTLTVELPDRQLPTVPLESVTIIEECPNPRVERALDAAMQFLGTKYVWGGKTLEGVDCSGLVQTSFAAAGVYLPRDANQQLIAGRLTAVRWHRRELRRGDTLYFLGGPGKITHTGIYLGDDQYIEAVRPTVRISSLNPAAANYSHRGDTTFAFAKRVVD